jgi:hypothetical protein
MNAVTLLLSGSLSAFWLYLVWRCIARGEATDNSFSTYRREQRPLAYWTTTTFTVGLAATCLWLFVETAWNMAMK